MTNWFIRTRHAHFAWGLVALIAIAQHVATLVGLGR